MDYFKFDLQLFAAANITLPTTEERSGILYYVKQVKTGETTYEDKWVAAADLATTKVKNGEDEPRAVAAGDIAAKFSSTSSRLDVVIADSTALTVKNTTPNTGVTVAVAKSFTVGTTDAYDPAGDTTANLVKGTVAFEGVSNLTVSVACADTTESHEVPASTVDLSADNKLTVSNGCAVNVGETPKTFTAAADGTILNLTVEGDAATGVAKLAAGSVTVKKTVGAVTTNAGAIVENTSSGEGTTITIASTGTVSALSNGAAFSLKTSADDEATNYAATTANVFATGDKVAVYAIAEGTTGTIDKISIESDGTVKGVKDAAAVTVSPAEITLQLAEASATSGAEYTKKYYKLTKTSTTVNAAEEGALTPEAITGDCIGYFEVTSAWNDGAPTVDVTFVGGEHTVGELVVPFPTNYAGKVKVDATKVAEITKSETIKQPLTALTISTVGASAADVSVVGLYHDATVDVTTTADSYLPWYELSGTENVINLPTTKLGNGAVRYYAIKVTQGEKGKVTYSIADAGVELTEAELTAQKGKTSYFTVTSAVADGKATYTVAFNNNVDEGGKAAVANLKDKCWKDLAISADGVKVADVAEIKVTGDTTEGALDKYDVNNIATGIKTDKSTKIDERNYSNPVYTFVEGKGKVTLINAGTGDEFPKTLYGQVSAAEANKDGNFAITIGDLGNTLSDDMKQTGYFTVTISKATSGNVIGSVEVNYTQGTNTKIPLDKVVDGEGKAVDVEVDASGLTAANVGSLSFDTRMSNTAKVTVTGIPAGIEVTAGSTTILPDTTTSFVKLDKDPVYALKNNASIDLTSVADGKTLFFAVTKTPNASLRYNVVTAAATGVETEPTSGNYYKVENVKGAITVTYHKDATTPIDLTAESGLTTLNAKKSKDITAITMTAQETVKDATASLTSLTVGAKEYKDGGAAGSQWSDAKAAGAVAFVDSSAFEKDKGKLVLGDDFKNADGTVNVTRYYEVSIRSTSEVNPNPTAKGVTEYVIGAGGTEALSAESKNFFTVVYDKDHNTVTVTYTPKTTDGISPATLGTLGAISLDGSDMPEKAKVLTLTKESSGDSIKWAVTKLPATVTSVVNCDGEGDSFEYATTSKLVDGATIKLADAKTTKYYEVKIKEAASKDNYGVNTCELVELVPTDKTGKKLEGDDLTNELKKHNYFEVNAEANPAIWITYHQVVTTEEKVEGKTVKYTKIDLDGAKVAVDASEAATNATITIGENDETSDSITYNVTGMVNGQSASPATGEHVHAIVKKDFVTTYAITYAKDGGVTEDDGIVTGDAGYIKLAKDTGTRYYAVSEAAKSTTTGVIEYTVTQYADKGAAEAASHVGIITVANGSTGYGVSVSYVGKDLGAVTEQFTINAKNVAETVTTIDLGNTAGQIRYAVTDVPATVGKVDNCGANDTYAGEKAVVLSDSLKLGGSSEAKVTYYIVGEDGKLTAFTPSETQTEPSVDDNYLSVTKNTDGTTYTISYTKAGNGTAFALDAKSKLTVQAGDIAEEANAVTVVFADSVRSKVTSSVTGAKGNVVIDGGANDTISYTTKFAWAAGIYYVPTTEGDKKTTLTAADAKSVTTTPSDEETVYNKVTVTVVKDVYHVAIIGVKSNGHTMSTAATPDIDTVVVDGTKVKNFNGADLANTIEVKGFATGASIVNGGTGTTYTVTGKMTIDNDATEGGEKTFEAVPDGTTATAISVKYVTDQFKGVSGEFAVSKDTGAFTGATTQDTNKIASVQVTSTGTEEAPHTVNVKFEGGKIVSVTDLDEGEIVKIAIQGGATYTYEYDATTKVVTRRDADGNKTYADADSDATNLATLVEWRTTPAAVALPADRAFNWETGDHYFTVSNSGTVEIPLSSPSTTAVVGTGTYVRVNVNADGKTITITGLTGTDNGTVNANEAFNGVVKIAAGIPLTYNKLNADKFTVEFTNVQASSSFANMNTGEHDVAGDKITTAALAAGKSVSVDSKIYTSGKAGTVLTFTDGKLASTIYTSGSTTVEGSITVAAGTEVRIADGSTIAATGASVTVVVGPKSSTDATTEIKSISGLESGKSVTVTKDGVATTYTGTDDPKKVTMTVVKANGDTETSNLTLAEDKGDVYHGTAALASVSKVFDFTDKTTGYAAFNESGVANVQKVAASATPSENVIPLEKGKYYVRTSVSKGTDGFAKLTITPMVFDGTELTTTGVVMDGLTVKVTGDATDGTKFGYAGGDFKTEFTNAAIDSSFTGLAKGSTVVTKEMADGKSISVNGNTYTASGAVEFTIYAQTKTTTNIVKGAMITKGTVTSSKDDGTDPQTLVYTSTAEAPNGVLVTYAGDGVPGSIKNVEAGETVTVTKTITATKATEVTTYEAITDGTTAAVYRTDKDGNVKVKALTADSGDVAIEDGYTSSFVKPDTKAFNWKDAVKADATAVPPIAAANAEGLFALTGTDDAKSVAIGKQDAATVVTHRDYGKTFVAVTYQPDGSLSLTKKKVGMTGATTMAGLTDAAFDAKDAVTVTVDDNKPIKYTRGAMGSLAIIGAGAGSKIDTSTNAWTAKDSISNVVLKGGQKVTIGSTDFTAGVDEKATTKVTIEGLANAKKLDGTGAAVADGTVPAVTAGTVLLTDAMKSITAKSVTSDKKVVESSIIYNKGTYDTTASQNIAVTVSNGVIVGVTGLDAVAGKAESFTIVKTTTDALGTPKTSIEKYTAVYRTENPKRGEIEVTREIDGVTSTHIFADSTLNILDSSVAWKADNQVTTQDFDWNKVGYFYAAATSKAPTVFNVDGVTKDTRTGGTSKTSDKVAVQAAGTIKGVTYDEYGEEVLNQTGYIYLEVTSTKSATGPATISKMRLVKVNRDGTFSDATGTIGKITINALDVDTTGVGIALPTHTATIAIENAAIGKSYSGLGDADTVTGSNAAAGTVTVSGKSGEEKKFALAADASAGAAFEINGKGEVAKGTFLVKDELTATANPTYDADTCTKSVKYEGKGNGATVKVTTNGNKTGGEIDDVRGLVSGDKVTITHIKGLKGETDQTITLTKDDTNVVTKKMEVTGWPAALVMTLDNDAGHNLLAENDFAVSNRFDYGAEGGEIGVFRASEVTGGTVTIAKQNKTDAPVTFDTASIAADQYAYVAVGATQDKDGNATIGYMMVMADVGSGDGFGFAPANTLKTKNISVVITAPTGGDLKLNDDAVQLAKVYFDESHKDKTGNPDPVLPTDARYGTVDTEQSEKAREFGITVSGAQAGKAYTGFTALDTIQSGTLLKDQFVTVGTTKYTLAANSSVTIRGDGNAVNGIFKIGNVLNSASPAGTDKADAFTTEIKGLESAIVKLAEGEIESLSGLSTAGQTVTVTKTKTQTGAVTTTTYKVDSVADNKMKVTRTVTEDGVTKTATAENIAVGEDIAAYTYKEDASQTKVSANFTWKSADGPGFFATDYTGSGTATKLNATITKSEVTAEDGKYYLKAELDGDGSISKLELRQFKDGVLGKDVLGTGVTAGGTITIDASTIPSGVALKISAALAGGNTKLVINDAPAKSEITNMRDGDELKTATLAVGDKVVVSADGTKTEYTAGAASFLKFKNEAKLVEGTLKFAADGGVTTTKYTVGVADATEKTPVLVKVMDGEVVGITGLETTGSAATVKVYADAAKTKAIAAYGPGSVDFTAANMPADYTTVSLAEDTVIAIGATVQSYVAGAAGAIKFGAAGTMKVVEGTLKFKKDGTVTSATEGVVNFDEAATGEAVGKSEVVVTMKDGKVVSIKGLRTGDRISVASVEVPKADGSGNETKTVTYYAKSDTVIEKTVGTYGTDKPVTAYLTTAKGDVVSAKYMAADASTDISDETNAIEGQLSWGNVSGRSTGYFELKKKTSREVTTYSTNVVEETKKSTVTSKSKTEPTNYVVANAATDELDGTTQTLEIGALQVKSVTAEDGTTKTVVSETDASKILVKGTTITVTAPTAAITKANGTSVVPALVYTKDADAKFNIVINKTAKGSKINGLADGDKVTTATLAAPTKLDNPWNKTLLDPDSFQTVTVADRTYVAGAKGALEFIGETTTSGEPAVTTNATTLLNGTVVLNAYDETNAIDNTTAVLAGAKVDGVVGKGADITVKVSAEDGSAAVGAWDNVIVAAKNGVISSITGLCTQGLKVEITKQGDTTDAEKVTYTVLYSTPVTKDGVDTGYNAMIKRTLGTGESATDTYGTFLNTKSVYAEPKTNGDIPGYKPAVEKWSTNLANLWTSTEDEKGKTRAYYVAREWDAEEGMNTATLALDKDAKDILGKDAVRGKAYAKVTVKTTADGVSTIQKVEMAQVNAIGEPEVTKNVAFPAKLVIDGTSGTDSYATVNYALATKDRNWRISATNVKLGSSFTGLLDGDQVTSKGGEFNFATSGKMLSFDVYQKNAAGNTDKKTVTYAGKDAARAIVKVTDAGVLESIKGVDQIGESITITEKTAKGEIKTVYAVTQVKVGSSKVTKYSKSVTDEDGKTLTYVPKDGKTIDANTELTDADLWTDDYDSRVAVSDFDWTMQKREVGYFQVDSKGAAAVKALTKAVTYSPTDKKAKAATYIAVSISGDGVLKGVEQMMFDLETDDKGDPKTPATYNTLVAYGDDDKEEKFKGTINVTAPTAKELVFNRALVGAEDGTIDDTAKVVITGAIADSRITNLKLGDTVTTAKLSLRNDSKKIYWDQGVTLGVAGDLAGNAGFTVGAAGALSFLVQSVDDAARLTLTNGTIALKNPETGTQGVDFAYVGDKLLTLVKGDVTIAAKTTTKNGVSTTTYTVGDIEDGDTFSVEDFAAGTVSTYSRSKTTLFCETVSSSGATTSVYTIGTKTSMASSALLTSSKGWTTYTDANAAFTETDKGRALVSGKAVLVDLKTLDSQFASDDKKNKGKGTAAGQTYDYVIDKYMAAPLKFAGTASVINNADYLEAVQDKVGRTLWVGYANNKYSSAYQATNDIAQTIKVTDGWTARGSEQADIMTGATKGKDTLIGAEGNDTLTGGAAADTFGFDFTAGSGKDVVKSYATGKDKIVIGTDNLDGTVTAGNARELDTIKLVATKVGKSTSADVLLHDGTYDADTGEADNSVLLSGMGNGKAVTINEKTYYFGSAASAKAMSFTYTEGAYYLANAAANTAKAGNTINVGTDSKKATVKTLGDAVTVDLSQTDHYVGIKAVNAKSSGNRVILGAGGTGATLTGGTYQSTLKGGAGADSLIGGSGNDVFWFETVEGADTVSGYASGKDSIYLGDWDGDPAAATEANGFKISASGANVVISNGDTGKVTLTKAVNASKAVSIVTDKETKNTLSYYVGSSTKANAFTATLDTDLTVEVADDKTITTSLKSYYLGGSGSDTLKLSAKVKNKSYGKLDLGSFANNLSSIETVDTSGLASGSTIELIGRETGTYTLKGTKGVNETFNLSKITGDADVTIAGINLDLKDVIDLGDIVAKKTSGANEKKNAYFTLETAGGEKLGQLTISGVAASKFTQSSYTGKNLKY